MVLHSSCILYGNAYAFIVLEYPAFHVIDFQYFAHCESRRNEPPTFFHHVICHFIIYFFPLFLKVISPKLAIFIDYFFLHTQIHFNSTILFSRWKSSTEYIHKDCTTHLSNIAELSNVLLSCAKRFSSSIELNTNWKMYISFTLI